MKLHKLHDYTLFLFVFSIPFEYWDPFGLVGIMSTSRLAGYIYLAASMIFLLKMFSLKGIAKYVSPLLILITWFTIMSILNNTQSSEKGVFNFTFFQNIIFLVLIINHIKYDPRLINKTLLIFSYSIFLLSIIELFGTGVEIIEGRLTIFGDNPNGIGAKASLAIVILINSGLKLDKTKKLRIIYLASSIPILSMLASTGSRGAFITLIVGLFIILMFQKYRTVKKVFFVAIGSVLFYFVVQYVLENETMNERMASFVETREIGARESIWQDGIKIFRENILFGVGETGLSAKMQAIYGSPRSVHNHFLYTLASGGILGLLLLIYFLGILSRSVINIYRIKGEPIYLSLFIIIVLTMFKAGGSFDDKSYFLIFGLVASMDIASTIIQKKEKELALVRIKNYTNPVQVTH